MSEELASGLAAGLRTANVRTVFGMPGGGPNLDMVEAMKVEGIDFVLTHSESTACMMAAAFGRVSGSAGVAIVTRGPGLTNAINGLTQATLDRYPLILISDTVPSSQADRISHQRLDQVAITESVTKWSGVLGSHDPEAAVAAAVHLATSPPSGAVHLAFDPSQPGTDPPAPPVSEPATATSLAEARALVSAARRPLVIVGLDALGSCDTVRASLSRLEIPILVTYEAAGVIPTSWSTYAGFFTGVPAEASLIAEADVVIGIGLDSVETLPGTWAHPADVLLMHTHDTETSYFPEAALLVGDYATTLPRILDAVTSSWSPPNGAGRLQHSLLALPTSASLRPQDVVAEARAVCSDAVATVDAGAHMLVAMPLWSCEEPNELIISNGLATMGFGLPAAIGTALARPGRRVVCFTGDGGLSMVLGELELLGRLSLNVTVIVFNDSTLSLIKLKQRPTNRGDEMVAYRTTDFAAIGEAMGIAGRIVTTREELRISLIELDGRPGIIDARIDAVHYPGIMATARG